MPKHQELPAEVGDRRRDLRDAIEHIIQADEIIAKTENSAGNRLKVARSLLRTASRPLEEAVLRSVAEFARSNEHPLEDIHS